MPSSVGNFKIEHNNPVNQKTKEETAKLPNATDLHITTDGNEKHKVLGVGPAPGKLKSPTDPNATFNVQGQDTSTIDITNIDILTGDSLTLRIESQSAGGQLPTLKVHWTYKEKLPTGVVINDFPVKAIGTPAEKAAHGSE